MSTHLPRSLGPSSLLRAIVPTPKGGPDLFVSVCVCQRSYTPLALVQLSVTRNDNSQTKILLALGAALSTGIVDPATAFCCHTLRLLQGLLR